MKITGKIYVSAMMMLIGLAAYADTIATEEIEILEAEVDGRTWRYYVVTNDIDTASATSVSAGNVGNWVGGSGTTLSFGSSRTYRPSSYAIITGVIPADGDINVPTWLPAQNGNSTTNYVVSGISDCAFKDCSGLAMISMHDAVIAIGDKVFENCTSLTNVSINANNVAMGRKVFCGCNALEHILLPNSLLSRFGNKLINNYDELRTYHYWSSAASPKRIRYIDGSFFTDELTEPMNIGLFDIVNPEMSLESNEQGRRISVELKETEIDGKIWRYYAREADNTSTGMWTGGSGTAATSVEQMTFDGAVILGISPTSGAVTIPDAIDGYAVVGIGDNAFNGCVEMISITLPDSITYMGDGVFYGCDNLNSIRLPEQFAKKIPQICPCYSYDYYSYAGAPSGMFLTISYSGLHNWSDDIDQNGLEIYQVVPLVEPNKDNFTVVLTSEGQDIVSIAINGEKHIATMLGKYNILGSWGGKVEPSYKGMLYGGISESDTSWGSQITSVAIGENVSIIGHSFFDDFPCLEEVIIPNAVEHIVPKCSTNHIDRSQLFRYYFTHRRGWSDLEFDRYYGDISKVSLSELGEDDQDWLRNLIYTLSKSAFENCNKLKKLTIPQCICSTNINDVFLTGKKTVTEVTIADGVTEIWPSTFAGWKALQTVRLPATITKIGSDAFMDCVALERIVIPASVTRIEEGAFKDCGRLEAIVFEGDAPDVGEDAFIGTPRSMVFEIAEGTIGWDGGVTSELPEVWNGRKIAIGGATGSGTGGGTGGGGVVTPTASNIYLTATNVVVHYVTNSKVSEAVTPVMTTGLVNIISEVNAGKAVAINPEWANNFEGFEAKFGSDFTAAITKETGKRDGAGNAMMVWQDYVAGTDPTDENDVFMASIAFDKNGDMVISWTPEFEDETEAAKRIYRKYGKVKLNDPAWTEIQDGEEENYNFYKVAVEMR